MANHEKNKRELPMISIIHPSRGRPDKSIQTICRLKDYCVLDFELIVSIDEDDDTDTYINLFSKQYLLDSTGPVKKRIIINKNRSSVEAINNAAKVATGDILMVISDDTESFNLWDEAILNQVEFKSDWILKTKDGIQDYIITMPIMDRAYYNRTGYIYHPDYAHLFCDTYLTCVADITGRKITSNLMFKHNHYSVNGTQPDELHKRNDATWKQGQETFIRLMNQFTLDERRRITDKSMRNWLRNKGVQI